VANFISLAQKDYFDKKFFHRVVPNFVIQGGCKRGDGSGSEDYSIRSEFSQRRYTTGSVGMASAGKDTEATQWFITHSPTPHLDGRYTIFAVVESGMEVVQRIEVGDQILDVDIKIPDAAGK
jgi:cyclophilin family peptidyl-prolyl cis-trans isomerase